MCFASIRLGLYDGVKSRYAGIIDGNNRSGSKNVSVRIAAGITTGAMAVLFAQPTDVVKVRLQAGSNGRSAVRYSSTLQAYKNIAAEEGTRGLWKGASIIPSSQFPFVEARSNFLSIGKPPHPEMQAFHIPESTQV
nr:mitochondrial uncoupling protein 2-like [Megalopta genalis]